MIKELFEIEPKQKNILIIFLGILFISFLQIFIFRKDLLDDSFYIVFGLSMSLTVCWSILNFIPMFLLLTPFFNKEKIIYENLIFGMGILILFELIVLTFLGYEYKLNFRDFIHFAIKWTVVVYANILIIVLFNQWIKFMKKRK